MGTRETIYANSKVHDKNVKRRFGTTGDWLLKHESYVAWKNMIAQPPILWLQGPPGSGKTVLTSTVIEDIDPSTAVVYLFYQFDQISWKGVDALSLIAHQLCECYWRSTRDIPQELYDEVQTVSSSASRLQTLIIVLVNALQKVSFILDGLDEQRGTDQWGDTCAVVDFLVNLCVSQPNMVSLWCSSQPMTPHLSNLLINHSVIEVKELARVDVAYYLRHKIPELNSIVSGQEWESMLEGVFQ